MNEIIQGIILIAVLLFLYFKNKEDKKNDESILSQSILVLAKSQEKLYEEISKFQEKHFSFSDKQLTKTIDLLNRQTKEFLGTVREAIREKENESELDKFIVTPISKSYVPTPKENDIEKVEENPEYPLGDIERVPITPGLKVQFEGQEEITPINIETTI